MKPNFQKLLSRKHAVLTDHILVTAWNDQKRFVSLTGFDDYVSDVGIVDGDFVEADADKGVVRILK